MDSPDGEARALMVLEAAARLDAASQRLAATELPHLESTAQAIFPVDLETLQLIASLAGEVAPRHVVMLGSSPVTEVLALLGFAHGRMVVTCYEHDPWAAEEWLNVASPFAINYRWFAFCLCPLVARRCDGVVRPVYDDRMTRPLAPIPADLVIVEGPPRELGGRMGAIYQVLAATRAGATVVVLDARADEAATIDGWARDQPGLLHVLTPGLPGRHLAFVVLEPLPAPIALETPRAEALAARGGV